MEEGARMLHQWSPEERDGEYVSKHKARLKQIGVGTLIQLASQNGFNLPAERTRSGIQQFLATGAPIDEKAPLHIAGRVHCPPSPVFSPSPAAPPVVTASPAPAPAAKVSTIVELPPEPELSAYAQAQGPAWIAFQKRQTARMIADGWERTDFFDLTEQAEVEAFEKLYKRKL